MRHLQAFTVREAHLPARGDEAIRQHEWKLRHGVSRSPVKLVPQSQTLLRPPEVRSARYRGPRYPRSDTRATNLHGCNQLFAAFKGASILAAFARDRYGPDASHSNHPTEEVIKKRP